MLSANTLWRKLGCCHSVPFLLSRRFRSYNPRCYGKQRRSPKLTTLACPKHLQNKFRFCRDTSASFLTSEFKQVRAFPPQYPGSYGCSQTILRLRTPCCGVWSCKKSCDETDLSLALNQVLRVGHLHENRLSCSSGRCRKANEIHHHQMRSLKTCQMLQPGWH